MTGFKELLVSGHSVPPSVSKFLSLASIKPLALREKRQAV